MQSISNISSHAADAAKQAQDLRGPAAAKGPEKNEEKNASQPKIERDEYLPQGEKKATGQYWLERQEGNKIQIHFDDPRKDAAAPAKAAEAPKANAPEDAEGSPKASSSAPAAKPEPAKADKPEKPEKSPEEDDPKKKTEECICDTGKVDREIEALRKRQADMKQQVRASSDPEKAAEMERELAQVERELAMKDNDGYRRQHAQFTNK